jgi:DNA primase catalytic subunit
VAIGVFMKNEIGLNEACRILGKSKRTITRYIKAGKLNPEQVKNEKGILEYRFNRSEVESLKNPDSTGQTTGQKQKIEQKPDDIIALIKVLEKQLKEKDKEIRAKNKQIANFQERQRETNYLLKGLQDRALLLEDKTKGKRPDKKHRTEDTTEDTPGDRINRFIKRWFGRK